MVKWVRSGVMEGATELVAELGGDFRALARAAGVPLAPMANPDLPMRVDRFVAFMELAAAKLATPSFGLQLGPRQSFVALWADGALAEQRAYSARYDFGLGRFLSGPYPGHHRWP